MLPTLSREYLYLPLLTKYKNITNSEKLFGYGLCVFDFVLIAGIATRSCKLWHHFL